VLIAAVAGAVVVPFVTGSASAYGTGTTVTLAVLLALGYQVTYGLGGQLSLAHAPLMGVGAYTTARLTTDAGWSWWPATALAVAAAATVGAVVSLPTLRVRGDVLALTTLGAGEVLQSLYLRLPLTGGYQGIVSVPPVTVAGHQFTDADMYLLTAACAGVVLTGVVGLRHSPMGRAMLAVRDDELAARSLGTAPGPIRVVSFVLGAAVAGFAGSLYAAQDGFVSSVSFGLTATMTTVTIVLLAGPARWGRTVLVAVIVTLVAQWLSGYGQVTDALTGAMILIVIASRLGLFHRVAAALRGQVPGATR
jgi:ABC-type branched-subunit amino acid transport system permease subunit